MGPPRQVSFLTAFNRAQKQIPGTPGGHKPTPQEEKRYQDSVETLRKDLDDLKTKMDENPSRLGGGCGIGRGVGYRRGRGAFPIAARRLQDTSNRVKNPHTRRFDDLVDGDYIDPAFNRWINKDKYEEFREKLDRALEAGYQNFNKYEDKINYGLLEESRHKLVFRAFTSNYWDKQDGFHGGKENRRYYLENTIKHFLHHLDFTEMEIDNFEMLEILPNPDNLDGLYPASLVVTFKNPKDCEIIMKGFCGNKKKYALYYYHCGKDMYVPARNVKVYVHDMHLDRYKSVMDLADLRKTSYKNITSRHLDTCILYGQNDFALLGKHAEEPWELIPLSCCNVSHNTLNVCQGPKGGGA